MGVATAIAVSDSSRGDEEMLGRRRSVAEGGWKAGRGKDRLGGHLFLRLCVGYEAASPGVQSPGFV